MCCHFWTDRVADVSDNAIIGCRKLINGAMCDLTGYFKIRGVLCQSVHLHQSTEYNALIVTVDCSNSVASA